jgi:hypothetical protein
LKTLKEQIMKRILYSTTAVLVSAGLLLSSCKDNNRLESGSIPVTPTSVSASEYAEFKEWKQQQLDNTSKTSTTTTTNRPVIVHKHYTVYESTPVKKKKGWSKAAKGTAIGAGAGAAAGALLVKNNRALGAVIGGVVGGGVGYGVGHSMDKKDGRP